MRNTAERYILSTDCSPGHAANMRRTAARMAEAGIDETTINEERVWHWLSSLKAKSSTVTVQSARGRALLLWRWGADHGHIARPPLRLPQVKVRRNPVRAWTREDLITLVKFVSTISSTFRISGCPKALWLEAWVRCGYETGLRHGDLWQLRRTHIRDNDRAIAITANKTRKPVVRAVSDPTMRCIRELLAISPDGSVFSWAISRDRSFKVIRRCLDEAGFHEGGTQWLRRSGATHVEIDAPGSASAFLGHSNPALAQRFYIDGSQLLGRTPQPRPLP